MRQGGRIGVFAAFSVVRSRLEGTQFGGLLFVSDVDLVVCYSLNDITVFWGGVVLCVRWGWVVGERLGWVV